MMSNTILLLAVLLACMASQSVLAVNGAAFGKMGAAAQQFGGQASKFLGEHSNKAPRFVATAFDTMKTGGAKVGDNVAHGAAVAQDKLGTVGVATVSGLTGAGVVHAVHKHDRRVEDRNTEKILKSLRRNDE